MILVKIRTAMALFKSDVEKIKEETDDFVVLWGNYNTAIAMIREGETDEEWEKLTKQA
jgi:hypothetical protein